MDFGWALPGPEGSSAASLSLGKVNEVKQRTHLMRGPLRMVTTLLAALFVVVFGVAGVISTQVATAVSAGAAVQVPPPSGDNGTTIDPLQYNCGNDAPTCGQVGESNGYYNGTNVDLLYSENYYCDANVRRRRPLAARPEPDRRATPSPTSAGNSGTSLGNTTHSDTLYIPVPLFSNPPPTQCTATATCIDHPPTIDLSRIAGALPGDPSPSSVSNVPIPAHDHVVGTRNSGLPEWWNVQVVATTESVTFTTLTSVTAINAAVSGGNGRLGPHQRLPVLPGAARHPISRPWQPT